ncbi:MAG: UDP-N-acetylglucosamine 2-epimerase (non-hydrolyzing) [Candidatus Tantalella remota]|nr:UDP-N-acetylglucosamine 2-epimerase (non-hydrolyzing) [Candidatus Tantalella remota]
MKIVSVIGARPQFVKAAVISSAFDAAGIEEVLVNTGQHYDYNMAGQFLEELGMRPPQYDLGVGQMSRAKQLAEMIRKLEEVVSKESPDLVMVYGDTTSTLAGALVANSLNVPVAHVEAGLRSYDKSMPEEVNRILTDNVADMLFCPTVEAVNNLEKEGVTGKVFNVGDIMYELALSVKERALRETDILGKLEIEPKKYVLATIHRQSNADDAERLLAIVSAFCSSEKLIVFPVHPRTKKMLKEFGLSEKLSECDNVKLIDPVGYMDMVSLEVNAERIVTDSGGVQKEAYFYEVPCVTVRDNTEWVETLNHGWNVLVSGTDEVEMREAIDSEREPSKREDYYGDGHTAEKIIKILKKG